MNNKNTLPIKEISKLADDIRLIQDFAENHNFNSNLLNAEVTTKSKSILSIRDWPLVGFFISMALVVCVIAILKFYSPLSNNASSFIFVIGILFATISIACSHMRFGNVTITIVVAIGLFLFLFIGADIFTPQEAITNLKELKK